MFILNVKFIKIFIFIVFNLGMFIMYYKCNDVGRCEVIFFDKGICYLLFFSIRI